MYLFILGKNPPLSLAELLTALDARAPFTIVDQGTEWVVIDSELSPTFPDILGGCLKMGRILSNGEPREQDFAGQFRGLPDRPIIGVSGYDTDTDDVTSFLKRLLKNEGYKPGFLHKTLTHTELLKKHVMEKGIEFLVTQGKTQWIARTVWVHNPWEFQKRDVERPVQRSMLSIPPRLSRILIHLSGKTGGILWDPFCGIGSILQEAMLLGFGVRGSDKNANAIEACTKNLLWISRVYKVPFHPASVQVRDARAEFKEVDCIVTEPYLGPPLVRHPGWKEAEQILRQVQPLYEKVLPGFMRSLPTGGRLVIVSPCFRTKKGLLRLPLEQIARRSGGRVIDPLKKFNVPHQPPLLEYEERHHTGREIVVIQKK